jgi:hypothetical protein
MATNIQSSRLDFNNIKDRLKTFLVSKPEFTDYDFEASGINNILDVLAYNTHFNGLTANFALNESFLNTAQLRSSVVSHAETLGYTPRSISSSVAYVNLSLDLSGVANRPSTISIPRFTSFTSTVADISRTFRTIANYVATDDGLGTYTVLTAEGSESIPIYQGTERTKTFFVGDVTDRQLYVIPDNTIDTKTIDVKVYDSPTSSTYTNYTLLDTATSVTADSTYYSIHEAPNTFYELHFSDGVTFGKSPAAGNKIVVTYLSTVGPLGNGGNTFTPVSPVNVNSVNYDIAVTTVSNSASGADKQSIESIRQNAPISFATQQRLVTADDYKALILKNYSVVSDAIAWGGQDNVPPEYGKVFISIKYVDNPPTAEATKIATQESITANLTNKLGIMSIDSEYVEPTTTFITTTTQFRMNPDATGFTKNALSTSIQTVINEYFTANLKVFGKSFRRSNLLSLIDAIDPGILNSKIDVTMSQRITPILGTSQAHTIIFPVSLQAADDVNLTITSSGFYINSVLCSIKNLLGSTKLQVIDDTGTAVVDDVGSFDASGTVSLTGLIVDSIPGGTYIKINAVPANQSTITPLRNYIIDNDVSTSFVTGIIES